MRLLLASIREDIGLLAELAEILAEIYPGLDIAVAPEPLEPPPGSYDPVRGQYRSEHILAMITELQGILGAGAILAIANVDAYANGLNFVFGEAVLGGGAAVVYTPRLRPEYYGLRPDKHLFMERLVKEAMHELGHGFGLKHCPNPFCVMSFSNSIVEVDRKKPAYCRRCAEKLKSNGIEVSTRYVLDAY